MDSPTPSNPLAVLPNPLASTLPNPPASGGEGGVGFSVPLLGSKGAGFGQGQKTVSQWRGSVDSNLRVSPPCDADGDVFVNSGADDLTPMSLIKVGDVGSAANKTDP